MAGIYIEKKTKYLPFITGGAAAANIASNFVLIPAFGMFGSAIATLISYFIMTAGIFFVSHKFYPVRYEYKKIIFILMFSLICYIMNLILKHYLGFELLLNILFILLFIISLFVSGILKTGELRKFLQSFQRV